MAKTLLQQNPWLRNDKQRTAAFRISAASSSAVEGIRRPFAETVTPFSDKAVKSDESPA